MGQTVTRIWGWGWERKKLGTDSGGPWVTEWSGFYPVGNRDLLKMSEQNSKRL